MVELSSENSNLKTYHRKLYQLGNGYLYSGIFTEKYPLSILPCFSTGFNGGNCEFCQKIAMECFFSTWTHVKIMTMIKKKFTTSNPNNKLLDPFGMDLFKLIKKVKFKREHNNFQMKLNKDIKEVKSSNCIWVRADKSKNMYKIKPSKYQEILKNKITDNYKIDYNNTIDQIK